MRIQHNIAALNANRMLSNNNNAVSKNLEKLSSGYKINRAGDDAAGLAISEKMRGQIRGLDQASNNASDGISLVQTAEGSLNETASILQRMKELATQSSNGTYQNDVDRTNIQKEVDSLTKEIDRISTSTNFNKINLLDGSQSKTNTISSSGTTLALDKTNPAATTVTLATAVAGDTLTVGNKTFEIVADNKTAPTGSGNIAVVKGSDDKGTAAALAAAMSANGITATTDTATAKVTFDASNVGKGITFQIGANNTPDQQVSLNIEDMSSKGLGLDKISVKDQTSAAAAIDKIDNAINTVSGTRADLGALQNRLEHTVTNLGTTSENLTSAESRIRDVDMAKEMMEMTKNNVLAQAAQSMLAQANTQPQNVLKLLQ